ncbi:MAG: hypothetical protein AAF202_03340, partial [Pseudomonadota bacterium]
MNDWQGEHKNRMGKNREGSRSAQHFAGEVFFDPANRFLLFSVLCSTILLLTFNNCGQISPPAVTTETAFNSDLDSRKMASIYSSNQDYEGQWIGGLDDISIRSFQIGGKANHLLLEAVDLNPEDMRESGLYKAFHVDLASRTRVDLCDDRKSQILQNDCRAGAIADAGTRVALITPDALMGTKDRDLLEDIFLVDLEKGSREVFSGGVSGDQIVGRVVESALSVDGETLLFVTGHWREDEESQSFHQIYLKSESHKFVRAVSVSRSGELANGNCWGMSLSEDARLLMFHSNATNLLPEVDDGNDHIFVKDLETGQLWWVDEPATGTRFREDTHSFQGQISGNGRYVIFASEAENLVPDDQNGYVDVFIRDLRAQKTQLISRTFSGRQGQGDCLLPKISANGSVALFSCDALTFGLTDSVDSSEVYLAMPEAK